MTSIRIRPRFKASTTLTPEEVVTLVREHMATLDCGCAATINPGYIVLRIAPKERHFWSPQLTLSFQVEEEGGSTIIRGLYGPNPTVWAIFAFGYGAVGILSLFIGLYGLSQYTLDQKATLLWALVPLAIAAIILYLVAQFGQKLGAEQTFQLHHFFEESLGKRIHLN